MLSFIQLLLGARHSAKYSSSNLIFTIVLGACYNYHSHFRLKNLNHLSKVTELESARAVNPDMCWLLGPCSLSLFLASSTASEILLHEIKKEDDLYLKPNYQCEVPYVVIVWCL